VPWGSKLAGKLLLWWLVAAVLPVAIIEAVLVVVNVRAYSQDAAETQLLLARSLSEQLNTRTAVVRTRLECTASAFEGGELAEDQLQESLGPTFFRDKFVSRVSIVDDEGRQIFSYPATDTSEEVTLSWAATYTGRSGTLDGDGRTSGAITSAQWSRLVRRFDRPVLTSRGGASAIVVSLDSTRIAQWLANQPLPSGSNLLLGVQGGEVLGLSGRLGEERGKAFEGAIRGGVESAVAYEADGQPMIATVVPLRHHDWVLLLESRRAGLFAMVEGARPGGVLLLLSTLLFLVVSGQLMRKIISRPIADLGESARRVAMGDYTARVNIRSGDEFEELGCTFNHMIEKIGRERGELESAYSLLSVLQGYNEQILEHAPNGIMVVDRQYRVTGWNRYLERAFGIERQQVLGKNVFEEFPAMEEEGFGSWLDEVFSAGEVKTVTGWRHRMRNVGPVILNVSISPICDEFKEIVSAAVIIEDVTDKTKTIDEAKFLGTIVKEAGDAILSTDVNGRITFVNKAGETTFGYSADELMGQHIAKLLGEDGRSVFIEMTTQTEQGELWEGEVVCRRKSEESIPVLFSVSRISSGAGGVPALILVAVDLTEKKKATEQIAYLTDLNDSIVASIRDGIIVIDCRERILGVNEAAAQRYGWDGQSVVGKKLSDLLPQLNVPGRMETVRRTMSEGEQTILRGVESERPDGTEVTENFTSYPLKRGGAVQGAVIVSEDVTNQTRRERQLEVLFEVSRALASTIDLDPMLERLVAVIREAFGFMYATVFLVDEERSELHLKSFSSDDPSVEPPEIGRFRICVDGAVGWAAYARETLVVPDVSTDARCVRTYDHQKSEMAIPLIRDSKVVGVLDVGSRASGGFPAGQRKMLEQLANQLAVAIVESELYEEAKVRVAELTALREVALAISSVLNIDLLLDQFVDIMQRSFGYSHVAVLLIDESANELYVKAHRGYDEPEVERLRLKVRSEGITGWVAHAGQPLMVNDVERDPRFVGCSSPIRSELAVPLTKDGQVIGVLDVASEKKAAFEENDLRVIQQLAGQIMISFKNATLYDSATDTVRELRALEAFNRSVLENMPSGIVTVDENGIVTSVNATVKRALHKDDEDVVGRPVDSIVKLAPGARCYLREAVERGTEVRRGEARVILEGGTHVDIGMSTSILRDEDGEITGAVGIITDLTKIKAMEEKMRRSDQLAVLGQMSASMAHEIKNPLAGISTGVEYLMESFDKADARREASQLILQEISRLDRIVRDLTSFAHRPPLYLVPLDLREMAKRTLCLLQQEIKAQDIQVETAYAEELPEIIGDEVQIGQVYLNLLLNGVQAMPEGGVLKVSIHPESRESRDLVVVEISDTGKGISPENLPKVFDPFFSTKRGGTGLGLAVTQRIVDDHGGVIEVVSEPGRGTTFRVELDAGATAVTDRLENEPETMAVKNGVYDSHCG